MGNSKIQIIILVVILIAGFGVRLYRFNNPIADWHAWRQADTSAVSRNFIASGFDVLHPRFDDLSNVPSGKDNPNGYRFVEFPIYNIFQAGFFKIFNTLTLEQWGRLVSIFSSLISCVFIYLLVKKYADTLSGLFAAFFYAFLPYSIFYSRTILPDTMAVMATLGAVYFFDRWIDQSSKIKASTSAKATADKQKSKIQSKNKKYVDAVLALVFTAAAFLLKPYALFFTLPMFYIVWKRFGFSFFKKWQLWVFVILSLLPLVLWRWWMTQYPEGIPVNDWLFNGGNIRFKGAYFYWVFADHIGKFILGYWGAALFAFGILSASRKKEFMKGGVFYAFLLSALLYLIVIARGNVQHDYYQIFIVPTLAIFLGLGSSLMLNLPKDYFQRKALIVLFIISTAYTLGFGWYVIRDYFNINNRSIIAAGEAVDRLTPKEAKVIANYTGDTSFLYQTKRKGWASYEKDLPEMIKMGAEYLVLANPNQDDMKFAEKYKIVEQTPQYIIFDLRGR